MKYVSKRKRKSGKEVWVFTAPKDVRKAGVLGNVIWEDGRTARYEAPRLLEIVKEFRRGGICGVVLFKDSTLNQVFKFFLYTDYFTENIANHDGFIRTLRPVLKNIGNIKLDKVDALYMNTTYREWLKDISSGTADARVHCLSKMFDYCMINGLLEFNPAKAVVKVKKVIEKEVVLWTNEQVATFITEAFKKFETTPVGILVLLSYHTGRTVTQLRDIKWSEVKDCSVVINGVTIPLPESALHVLKQQKDMWDFQDYVLPYKRGTDNAYRPMTSIQMSHMSERVKKSAGIPEELQITDIRKTGIRQLIKDGIHPVRLSRLLGVTLRTTLSYYPEDYGDKDD